MEWITLAVRILFLILSTVASVYVLPWLKEKHLHDVVYKMVSAAEKWSQTHEIDKKQWVIDRLTARGVNVNEYVDALIEACVEELDIQLGAALIYLESDDEKPAQVGFREEE